MDLDDGSDGIHTWIIYITVAAKDRAIEFGNIPWHQSA
jgi:hypothetical protein